MPPNRLRVLRAEHDLTLKQVADAVGVDTSTVSRWERQKLEVPDRRKQHLAEHFAVSVPYLMGWDDEPRRRVAA